MKFPDHLVNPRPDPEERRRTLDLLVKQFIAVREKIFADKPMKYHFEKFIAPVQLNDVKPPNFILPFDLTPP